MTRGNQREKDRARAQARNKATTGNSCIGQQKLDQADIMRQKQEAAEKKKKEKEEAERAAILAGEGGEKAVSASAYMKEGKKKWHQLDVGCAWTRFLIRSFWCHSNDDRSFTG